MRRSKLQLRCSTWLCVGSLLLGVGCGDPQKAATRDLDKDSGSERDGSASDVDAAKGGGDDGGKDSSVGFTTCADAKCDTHATCADVAGNATCECTTGYVGDGKTCGDINECAAAALHECGAHADCVNTPGGYDCDCQAGYDGNGATCSDVDECTLGTKACDVNATCTNTPGGATCACKSGYVANGAACDDVNECTGSSPPSCDVNATCVNTPGSAFCMCNAGYNGDGLSCATNTACPNGNECDTNATCSTVNSGPFCVCNAGYAGNGGTGNCAQIDECATNMDNCHSAANCTDTPGSFTCACKSGFSGNGITCSDIDECAANTDNCAATATCTNTPGSFTCTCKAGYTGDGVTCTNINECSLQTDDCHADAICTDTVGSFTCACRSGFIGDGKANCTDIDECQVSGTCGATETCTNLPGTYTCGCNAPYVKNGNACYCDLTGMWGMRQNVTSSWPAVYNGIIKVINAGTLNSTVWELHRMVYDGSKVVVKKKGCGPNKTPDLRGTAVVGNETYGTYIPTSVWNGFGLFNGADVTLAAAKPGSSFNTPKEAAVLGIKLNNPLTDPWPSLANAVVDDAEGDGVDGLMVWSHNPTETTQAGNKYSYPYISANRAVCVTTALRTINHLEGTVIDCGKITGDVKRDLVPGQAMNEAPRVDQHTYACRIPVSNTTAYGCTKAEWDNTSKMTACGMADVNGLDAQVDQTTVTATFELVKLNSNPDANVTCNDVRTMLPAYP